MQQRDVNAAVGIKGLIWRRVYAHNIKKAFKSRLSGKYKMFNNWSKLWIHWEGIIVALTREYWKENKSFNHTVNCSIRNSKNDLQWRSQNDLYRQHSGSWLLDSAQQHSTRPALEFCFILILDGVVCFGHNGLTALVAPVAPSVIHGALLNEFQLCAKTYSLPTW